MGRTRAGLTKDQPCKPTTWPVSLRLPQTKTIVKGKEKNNINTSKSRKLKKRKIEAEEGKMSETKNKFESIREWIVEHKLRTVGNVFS